MEAYSSGDLLVLVWHGSGHLFIDISHSRTGLLAWIRSSSGDRDNYEDLMLGSWFVEASLLRSVVEACWLSLGWEQNDEIYLAVPLMLYGSHIKDYKVIFPLDI